jgi:hypothetical protein
MINYHLAVLKKPYLDAILAGQKLIESRFWTAKHPACCQVHAGDRILLKLSCGPVCAAATAASVKNFEDLTPQKMNNIKHRYNHHILGCDKYWQGKMDCKFALLIWLKDVEQIEPVRISKKDRRTWVVLTKQENFGLLKQCLVKKDQ